MIGILGGTFDPIHYGHLRPARDVQQALGLTELRVIPAANPPHRRAPVATAEQRFKMVELACAEFPGFHADCREITRGGASYTVLTLQSLRQEFRDAPLCLLMGVDAFEGLETWHQWQRLPELAHIVVMTRPGWSIPAILPPWAQARLCREARELQRLPAGKIFFQPVSPQDISATRIRESLARGEAVDAWLPPVVAEYIRVNSVYIKRNS